MTIYATQQDMLSAFGEREMISLTDIRQPRLDAVNTDVLNTSLTDASAEIDGYLAGQVALPLTIVPNILRVYCIDMARYRLQHTEADEQVKARYDAAIAYLKMVAKGDVRLTLPAGGDVPEANGGGVQFTTGSKVMGRESYA
jgi:phage gp36-like protein